MRQAAAPAHATKKAPNQMLPYTKVRVSQWECAIDDYEPVVTLRNRRALGTSASAYARYLIEVHRKIHVFFADSFLASLDKLPKDDPLNADPEMHSDIELVIDGKSGNLVTHGVIRSSGVRLFDAGALASIAAAFPVAPVPPDTLSTDDRVYLHWEFHRDPNYGCSTWFAHPYKLELNSTDSAPSQSGSPFTGAKPSADRQPNSIMVKQ